MRFLHRNKNVLSKEFNMDGCFVLNYEQLLCVNGAGGGSGGGGGGGGSSGGPSGGSSSGSLSSQGYPSSTAGYGNGYSTGSSSSGSSSGSSSSYSGGSSSSSSGSSSGSSSSSSGNLSSQGYPSSTSGYGNGYSSGSTSSGSSSGSSSSSSGNLSSQGYPSSTEGYNPGAPASTGNLSNQGYPSSTEGYNPNASAGTLSSQGYPSSTEGYNPGPNNFTCPPAYFNQLDFSDDFGELFGNSACAVTSLVNELSEQYTANTGFQMTEEQAVAAIQAAIDSGNVSANGATDENGNDVSATVNNWEGAANDMWGSTGQEGNYTYGGDNPTAVIYAEDPDGNGIPNHFTNSNGENTYHDPWDGHTGTVNDTPLQSSGLGSTRPLTYHHGN